MVILLITRSKIRLLVCVITIELVRDLAEDRDELGLLVELEVIVDASIDLNSGELHDGKHIIESRTMDGQGWDSK